MASTFMFSIWPLLPVSMAEMPSIMMLFWPAPPRRVPPADAPVCTTPGVNAVSVVKLLRAKGSVSICLLVTAYDRSPLCVCTSGDWPTTVTVSAMAPGSSVMTPMPMRSPPLTATPLRLTVLKASSVTSTV
jgi:hypothetical protein